MEKSFKAINLSHSASWTPEVAIENIKEQNLLKNMIEVQGLKNWGVIANKLKQEGGKGMRTGKQCRERYMNYIKFDGERSQLLKWTPQQQQKLFHLYQEVGSKWVLISKSFDAKSENCLKNKFYGSIRKLVRRLNAVGKNTKKSKKQIKYESILRPLEHDLGADLTVGIQGATLIDLRNDIICAAKNGIEDLGEEGALQLIHNVNKFNLSTRCSHGKVSHVRKNSLKLKKCETVCEEPIQFLQKFVAPSNKDSENSEGVDLKKNQPIHEESVYQREESDFSQRLIDLTFYEIQRSSGSSEMWPGVCQVQMPQFF